MCIIWMVRPRCFQLPKMWRLPGSTTRRSSALKRFLFTTPFTVSKPATTPLVLRFYLNKYELNKNASNFDYGFVWQYPFERKMCIRHTFCLLIAGIYIFMLLCETVQKAGQWLLKINGAGKLVKGTKLNASCRTRLLWPACCLCR